MDALVAGAVPAGTSFSQPGGRRWWADWSPFICEDFRQVISATLTSQDAMKLEGHPVIQAVHSFEAHDAAVPPAPGRTGPGRGSHDLVI